MHVPSGQLSIWKKDLDKRSFESWWERKGGHRVFIFPLKLKNKWGGGA